MDGAHLFNDFFRTGPLWSLDMKLLKPKNIPLRRRTLLLYKKLTNYETHFLKPPSSG
jgi:hypothetical protein